MKLEIFTLLSLGRGGGGLNFEKQVKGDFRSNLHPHAMHTAFCSPPPPPPSPFSLSLMHMCPCTLNSSIKQIVSSDENPMLITPHTILSPSTNPYTFGGFRGRLVMLFVFFGNMCG